MALTASILFFSSVLAHELAHSLVARARGLPVNRITLFLFGGVSNLEREPESPGTEFLMTIVGPLTSFLLGGLFLLAGGISAGQALMILDDPKQIISQLNPLSAIFLWLGPINLILGIFNLIPGFPLDGGRVLRSIIWAITGNLRLATRIATFAGQLVAWIFIIIGISMIFGAQVPIFGSGIAGGAWLAFIGWFLNNAAQQSYQRVIVDDILGEVSVSRLMRADNTSVESNISVRKLVFDHMIGTDRRVYPVVKNKSIVGLVSLEDVRKVPQDSWDKEKVSAIMTPVDQLEMTSPQESAAEALLKLVRRDVGQVPVMQNGHLVGMLSRRDILLWLQLQRGK